jgi:hypothetical protein
MLRQRAWGEAILNRLEDSDVPADLAKHVRDFKVAQAGLEGATRRARKARERRDAGLQALARADGALERAILTLGKRLVSAGLATKKNAFEGRAAHTPAELAALDHGREVAEVGKLLATFRGQRVAAPVRKAIASCAEHAVLLDRARARVQALQTAYARALEGRDGLLQRWTTALARLKRRASEIWADSPETVAQIFAPLEDDQIEEILDLRPVLPTIMNGVHTN